MELILWIIIIIGIFLIEKLARGPDVSEEARKHFFKERASRKEEDPFVIVKRTIGHDITNIDNNTEQVTNRVRRTDPNFLPEKFIIWAEDIFVKVANATTARKYNSLEEFESDYMYKQHVNKIKKHIHSGVIKYTEDIEFEYAELYEYTVGERKEHISVTLIVSMIEYKLSEHTGELVSGDKRDRQKIIYRMTFARNTGSKTDEVTDTCRSCGAKIEAEDLGKCKHCGTITQNRFSNWLLTNMEKVSYAGISYNRNTKNKVVHKEEVDKFFKDIYKEESKKVVEMIKSQIPRFSENKFGIWAKQLVVKLNTITSDNDLEVIKPYISNEIYRRYKSGIVYEDIGTDETQGIEYVDFANDTITLSLEDLRLYFIKNANDVKAEEIICFECGAPIGKHLERCTYCNDVVINKAEWILNRIERVYQ